jgi:photosystem II stability/assembly factor-like uncharacterized protein
MLGTDSLIILLSTTGAYSSLDTGKTWRILHKGLSQVEVSRLLRVDTTDFMITGTSFSRVGPNGEVNRLILPADFKQAPFVSTFARHGNTIYTSGFPPIMKSTDAGRTWKVYYSPEAMTTRCVTIGGDYLYTASADGFIYRVRLDDLDRVLRDPGL